jgi:hypothetical protein
LRSDTVRPVTNLAPNDWFIDRNMLITHRKAGPAIVELPVTFLEDAERWLSVRFQSIAELLAHMRRPGVIGRP